MKRRITTLLVVLGALFWSSVASASHFRYGTISWTVPHAFNAPLTVAFTVTVAWRSDFLPVETTSLDFGDGVESGPVAGTFLGAGVDVINQPYSVYQYSVMHTYDVAGTFTASIEDCCRVAGLQGGVGMSGPFRIESQVSLVAGNTGGPISASPPVIQLQTGGVRTYTFPFFELDGDPVSCRFPTTLESGLPETALVPTVPLGGAQAVLTSDASGCTLTWDLTQAVVDDQHVAHIVFDSAPDSQVSSTAIDLIVEMIAPPPPTCAGSGTFIVDVGQAFSASTTGTDPAGGLLTVSTLTAPPAAVLTPPSGSIGLSPFSTTFTWTPAPIDAGKTRIVLINYTNAMSHTGTCFLTIAVPSCAAFGTPCLAGIGECQSVGFNVCASPGVTVCKAIPGTPVPETCDGLDNDCDGTADDGDPDSGAACATGLAGACSVGTTICTTGAIECTPTFLVGELDETCNTVDDDCDGTADDGLGLGEACSNGQGVCATLGALVCDAGGGVICDAGPAGTPDVELCGDVLDNDCDGAVDEGCTDDSDADGLLDIEEVLIGTDPADADSDDDGVLDGDEPDHAADTDGDGLINALDADSDDDGLFDGTELGNGCSGEATDLAMASCIPDGDAGATTTDPLDADTDDGTVKDGVEDTNHDGVVDTGERDPNDPADDVVAVECMVDSDCGILTSGRVCDPSTLVCVDGCRATGNGCPDGSVCSSSNDAAGTCTPVTPAAVDAFIEGGFDCATSAGGHEKSGAWVLALVMALGAARRRALRPGASPGQRA